MAGAAPMQTFSRKLSALPRMLLLSLMLACPAAFAGVTVSDDTGQRIALPSPARRIISLAPHATELLYAAGAGGHVVGVSEYSNYPPQAGQLPSIGSVFALDLERIIQLKPDLIVVWSSGNVDTQIGKLHKLGIPIFRSEPRDFAAIPSSIERLSRLAGTEATGKAAADAFRTRLRGLEAGYRNRSPVSVFYQIWRAPLMTLNGAHLVSAALRICGGRNIFDKLPQLVPTVDIEAVLQANPQAIIASSGAKDDPFTEWRRFPALHAVAHDNLLTINGELLNRASPRILDGVEELCQRLDDVRRRK
jgi:iron complex transport system substrate-binding protein